MIQKLPLLFQATRAHLANSRRTRNGGSESVARHTSTFPTTRQSALALDGPAARVYLLAGQAAPGPDTSARGRVVWQFDTTQDAPPADRA